MEGGIVEGGITIDRSTVGISRRILCYATSPFLGSWIYCRQSDHRLKSNQVGIDLGVSDIV